MKRYEFTGEEKEFEGRKLMRIRWLETQRMGGWIESEDCLPQDGSGAVYDEAIIFDPAIIRGGTVYGGIVREGIVWSGRIFGGTIWGGTILGGIVQGGTILGGVVQEGTIRRRAVITSDPILTNRSDGRAVVGYLCDDGLFRISTGDHHFTIAEARKHWSRGYRSKSRVEWLAIVDYMEKMAIARILGE